MNPSLSKVDSEASLAYLVEDNPGGQVGTNLSFICNETCTALLSWGLKWRCLLYLCFPDMTFRGPASHHSFPYLNYTCLYNDETTYSTWQWTDPWANHSYIEMPKCSVFCPSTPPEPIEGKMTRTWNEAQWAGSSPVFKCSSGNITCNQSIGLAFIWNTHTPTLCFQILPLSCPFTSLARQ